MRKTSIAAMALALPLVFGTAAADSNTASLDPMLDAAPMSETDLNSVTGGFYFSECFFCSNNAYVSQLNLALASSYVNQSNQSYVYQSIN